MNRQEYGRFNELSEKLLIDTATSDEQAEFHQLLKLWNSSSRLNFFKRLDDRSPYMEGSDLQSLSSNIKYYD